MRYLTVALCKGRLAKKSMELFDRLGISCEEMNDPASRHMAMIYKTAIEGIKKLQEADKKKQ